MVEVDIRHQGYIHLAADLTEGIGGGHGGHRHPHDVCAGILNAADLGHGGGHVGGLGVGHALHRDGGVATHRDITHHNLAGFATLDG